MKPRMVLACLLSLSETAVGEARIRRPSLKGRFPRYSNHSYSSVPTVVDPDQPTTTTFLPTTDATLVEGSVSTSTAGNSAATSTPSGPSPPAVALILGVPCAVLALAIALVFGLKWLRARKARDLEKEEQFEMQEYRPAAGETVPNPKDNLHDGPFADKTVYGQEEVVHNHPRSLTPGLRFLDNQDAVATTSDARIALAHERQRQRREQREQQRQQKQQQQQSPGKRTSLLAYWPFAYAPQQATGEKPPQTNNWGRFNIGTHSTHHGHHPSMSAGTAERNLTHGTNNKSTGSLSRDRRSGGPLSSHPSPNSYKGAFLADESPTTPTLPPLPPLPPKEVAGIPEERDLADESEALSRRSSVTSTVGTSILFPTSPRFYTQSESNAASVPEQDGEQDLSSSRGSLLGRLSAFFPRPPVSHSVPLSASPAVTPTPASLLPPVPSFLLPPTPPSPGTVMEVQKVDVTRAPVKTVHVKSSKGEEVKADVELVEHDEVQVKQDSIDHKGDSELFLHF